MNPTHRSNPTLGSEFKPKGILKTCGSTIILSHLIWLHITFVRGWGQSYKGDKLQSKVITALKINLQNWNNNLHRIHKP